MLGSLDSSARGHRSLNVRELGPPVSTRVWITNAEGVEHQSPASRSARWVTIPERLVPRTGFNTTPGQGVKPRSGYCCMVATDPRCASRPWALMSNRVAVRLNRTRMEIDESLALGTLSASTEHLHPTFIGRRTSRAPAGRRSLVQSGRSPCCFCLNGESIVTEPTSKKARR